MNRIASPRSLRRVVGLVLLVALVDLTTPDVAWSQDKNPGLPVPTLLYVSPTGMKAGTTTEIALTGVNVDMAEGLMFDVPGVTAELVHVSAPVGPPDPRKKGNQQKGPTVTARFKVTMPADAPPGIHDVRLVSKWGVSNPRAFVVGDLEEIEEQEPNNDLPQAQRVPLNCSISGTISTPTDVDYYLFEGKKGQRVVVSCLASSIDSRLQPQLQLYSRAGSMMLGLNRDYNGTDAVVDAILPADGEYYVRVCAFTYTQGGPEHFYRLTISTAPWIDAVFPPMVEPGKETTVTVYGRNLPGGVLDPTVKYDTRPLEKLTVKVRPPADAKTMKRLTFSGHIPPRTSGLDGFELRLKNAAGTSNPYLLTYAQAPVVLDNGANETEETAQEVKLPCEIAGWIEKVRDRDWYRFSVKKGETYSIEAYGDRIGSALDLYFTLKQDKGKSQEFDDNPDTLHPVQFYTRTEDPLRYRLKGTEDATYLLQISSREADSQAGPRHLYRLRIAPEKPEFRLIVLPPTANGPDGVVLHSGAAQVYSVLVWRNDGFAGDIALSADGLPPGVACPPQVIGPGMKQAALVLTASADAASWTGTFNVKGRAQIAGKEVEVEARPADVTWSVGQQNIPTVARLSRSLALAVRDGAPFQLAAHVQKPEVHTGDKVTVAFKLKRHDDFKGPVLVTLLNPPPNTQATFNGGQPFTLNAGMDEATAVLELKAPFPPGLHSFAFRAAGAMQYARDPDGKQKATANVTLAATPITVTVVPKELATVKVSPGTPNLKIGQDTEVVVKVTRLFDYAGEFKVQLVVPADVKGVSADEVTIAADQDEVKLPIRVAAGTSSGNRNLIVRTTAMFNGKVPTTQEAKLPVNVVK